MLNPSYDPKAIGLIKQMVILYQCDWCAFYPSFQFIKIRDLNLEFMLSDIKSVHLPSLCIPLLMAVFKLKI